MSPLADRILGILRSHSNLKAREIASRLGTNRTEVNSLLYGALAPHVVRNAEYRWSLRDQAGCVTSSGSHVEIDHQLPLYAPELTPVFPPPAVADPIRVPVVSLSPTASTEVHFDCLYCGRGVRAPADSEGKKGRCPRCQQNSSIPSQSESPRSIQLPRHEAQADHILPFRWIKRILAGTPAECRSIQEQAKAILHSLEQCRKTLSSVSDDTPQFIANAVDGLRGRERQKRLESFSVGQLAALLGPATVQTLLAYGYASLAHLHMATPQRLQTLPGIGPATTKKIIQATKKAEHDILSAPIKIPLPDEIESDHHSLLQAAGRLVNFTQHVPNGVRTEVDRECQELKTRLSEAQSSSTLLTRMWQSKRRQRREAVAHQRLAYRLSSRSNGVLQEATTAIAAIEPPEDLPALIDDYRQRFASYTSVLDRFFAAPPPSASAAQPDECPLPDVGRSGPTSIASENVMDAEVVPKPAVVSRRGIFGGVPESIATSVEQTTLSLQTIKMHLRGYQEFGAKFLIHQGRTVLGDEMGLGKTIQAMAALSYLYETQQTIRCLIVAPASIVGNWSRELGDKTSLPICVMHGKYSRQEQQKWLREGGVGITSYTLLARILVRYHQPLDMLIADEAHYVKNSEAKRSKGIEALARLSNRVVLMTGTPLENGPQEFINLIRLCNPTLSDQLAPRMSVVSPANFEAAIAPVYLRRNQEDVLHELPECLMSDEWISLSASDRSTYDDAVHRGAFMTIRRAAIGADRNEGKLKRLSELLEQHRDSAHKVVVFSYFLEVLDRVGGLLGQHWRIDGGVPADRRMERIDSFSKHEGFAAIVCQIAAAGVGLNLHAASVVILMEPQLKPTTEWQAIKRVHRMGQTRRVIVHRLLARDTVEERLIEILESKATRFEEYARESAVKQASPAAVDTSIASLEQQLVREEMRRIGAA